MFLDLVKSRYSLRRYSGKPVERERIDRCLEAARLAPSACNSQPWKFIVVDEPELKEKLAKRIFSGVYSMNSFAKRAPVLIVVVSERGSYLAKIGGYFRGVQYQLIDLGITCEHFVLQAQEEGLGTCWLGWFNEKETKSILDIPDHKKVDIVISLGYPEEDIKKEKRRKTKEEVGSYNKYSDSSS